MFDGSIDGILVIRVRVHLLNFPIRGFWERRTPVGIQGTSGAIFAGWRWLIFFLFVDHESKLLERGLEIFLLLLAERVKPVLGGEAKFKP